MWPFDKKQTKEIQTEIETIITPDLETKTALPFGAFESLFQYALNGVNRVSPMRAMEFYRSSAALATAVDMISDACEEIDFSLKIGDEYVDDHELIDLLYNPNGYNSKKQFFGKIFRFYNLTSNSYLLALGNYRFPPGELHSLNPVNVSPTANVDGYPDHYMVTNTISNGKYNRTTDKRVGNLTRFTYEQMSEIYHIMGFSSDYNDVLADSPLNAIMTKIRQLIQGDTHNLSILLNGGRPSLHFDFGDSPTPEQIEERKALIVAQSTGSENAGNVLVTGSGNDSNSGKVTVSDLGTTNKDMDFALLQNQADLTIYNRYKIPLPLVTLKAATFNNIHNAILYFYQATVLPVFNTITQDMTAFLVPKYKDLANKGAYITYNPDTIDALMTKRLDELIKRKTLGVETVNELRSMIPGRDDIEGGEVLAGDVMVKTEEEEPEDDTLLPKLPDGTENPEDDFKDI